ncbi:tumor necrosis factor receptor superfamily member 5 [Parambassis ranga]|uniref:Tumor necrosis factor receptor superfamily member 5 n=1 Tax=Parambassis ranga TaxID=210632 RepID=A0A6P7JTQ3_9TELE|nr:tumor necrosis factor receptor superfamily member 5-like [Parambassis ranga]
MGFVQYFVAALILSALLSTQLVLTSPAKTYIDGCSLCPAGKYRKSCTECAPCPPGTYTDNINREDSCHRCYGDCKSVFHLKVIQNCTSTSDLRCVCEVGYRCTKFVTFSENCRECDKIQDAAISIETAVTSTTEKQAPPSASPGHSSISPKLCPFPKCSTQPELPADNGTHPKPVTEKTSSPLAAILCPVAVIVCVALVVLFCVHRPGDEACFRQTIAKLCNKEGQDVSQKESTHQFPGDSFSAKQPSSSLPSASLGPVYVHNPGTVIFSLLSQFTGQVGLTTEGGKTTERMSSEEEDERNCPVVHPTSPHSIHLSEEERSREMDSIFFPSQEQGKDCHVSKEEAL